APSFRAGPIRAEPAPRRPHVRRPRRAAHVRAPRRMTWKKNGSVRRSVSSAAGWISHENTKPRKFKFKGTHCFRAFVISWQLSDLAHDRRGHVARRRSSAEIRRAALAAGNHALDRADDSIVEIAAAEMVEQQRAGPDRADRIRDALSGDVGRRAMDWLEHRRVRALRVDVRARRNAKTARDRRPEVREDVAEQVRSDDDVERLWMGDHARGQRVDVILS